MRRSRTARGPDRQLRARRVRPATEREIVKRIVTVVEAAGYTVFYDEKWKSTIWGRDLSVFLDQVYREGADFCVVMASEEYLKREWPRRELQS